MVQYILVTCFGLCCMACKILVPKAGIKHRQPAVEVMSLNHWPRKSQFILYMIVCTSQSLVLSMSSI